VGKAFFLALLILVLSIVVVAGIGLYALTRRGLSTRVEPTRLEEIVARGVRRLATPSAVRAQSNPVPITPEVLDEAMGHFADHCATCHANDGSGDTSIGRSFYPKTPDMRASPTQSLSDGELFSIIEHGIRLTGMPAWGDGTPEGERGSWGLVHFIRKLPSLTADEIDRMEALNPKTPAEFREADEARRFLAGDSSDTAEPAKPAHAGH
jgi:mono/diheme cytochrome c family protein